MRLQQMHSFAAALVGDKGGLPLLGHKLYHYSTLLASTVSPVPMTHFSHLRPVQSQGTHWVAFTSSQLQHAADIMAQQCPGLCGRPWHKLSNNTAVAQQWHSSSTAVAQQ